MAPPPPPPPPPPPAFLQSDSKLVLPAVKKQVTQDKKLDLTKIGDIKNNLKPASERQLKPLPDRPMNFLDEIGGVKPKEKNAYELELEEKRLQNSKK